MKIANETLKALRRQIENNLRYENLVDEAVYLGDLGSASLNRALSVVLEAKDVQIENLENDVNVLDNELKNFKFDPFSLATSDRNVRTRKQVSLVNGIKA